MLGDLSHPENETHCRPEPALTFTHPDDVLHSPGLSGGEKRSILAAWASDAHAVPNLPAMRQLDSGAMVKVDEVLAALQTLDASEGEAMRQRPAQRASSAKPITIMRWRRPFRHDGGDDDDDPPPCPTTALPPGVELELRRRRDADWMLSAA